MEQHSIKKSPTGKHGTEESKQLFRLALTTKPPPMAKEIIDKSMFDADIKGIVVLNAENLIEKKPQLKKMYSEAVIQETSKDKKERRESLIIGEEIVDEKTDTDTDEESLKSLPKEEWEAVAMKKHPTVLSLRERVRAVNKYTTYAKNKNNAKTENVRTLSPQEIIQLITNHLYMIDKRELIPVLEEESGINFIAGYDALREESRLATLLKLAKRRLPKGIKILDPDLKTKVNPFQPHEMEISNHLFSKSTENAEEVNVWLEINSWDNVYIKSNNLQATSLNKLVILFCTHNVVFMKVFCATMESFCSPTLFFEKLKELYHGPPNSNSSENESLSQKVLTSIKFWTRARQDLWPINGRLRAMLFSWMESYVIKDGFSKQAENIKKQLELALKLREKIKLPNSDIVPEPKIPKNIFSPKLKAYHVDPEELARQLTLIYADHILQLSPKEVLNKNWTDSHRKDASPTINGLIDMNKNLTKWIILEIINSEKKKTRAIVFTTFIKLASYLKTFKNLHAMQAVVAAITSEAIKTLKSTHLELTTQVKEELEQNHKFMEPTNFRKATRLLVEPCIPPLDIILEDILKIEDESPNEIDGLFNVEKRFALFQVIEPLLKATSGVRKYLFRPIEQIQHVFGLKDINIELEQLIEEAKKAELQK